MIDRRNVILSGAALLGSTVLGRTASAQAPSTGAPPLQPPLPPPTGPYKPVITPNGTTLPWKMENGVKVFHLFAEEVKREFAPGMIVNCWGYNGQTPGPTIEAVEGDRVRFLVKERG